MPRHLYIVLLVAALLPSAWLAWTYRDLPHLGHHHDDAIYFVTAKGIAESGVYRIVSLPGEPRNTKYPPGLPLYLALAWRLNPSFPGNLSWVVLLSWVLLPLLVLACRWAFPETPWIWLFFAINPSVVFLSLGPMTEVPSLCLLVLTLGLSAKKGPRYAGLAGLSAAAGFLIKNALLMLLPAAVIWYLLRRRFREASVFTAAMLPVVIAWQIWSNRHATLSSIEMIYYTHYPSIWASSLDWSNLSGMFLHNLTGLVTRIGALFSFATEDSLAARGGCVLVAIAAISGCIRLNARHGISPYAIFAIFYSLQLLVWNFKPNERLIFPLFPLLLTGIVTTTRDFHQAYLDSKNNDPIASRVIGATGMLLLAYLLVRNADGVLRYLPEMMSADRAKLTELQHVWSWIRENTPADARIGTPSDDALSYLYTGRKAIARQPPTRYLYDGNREGILAWFSDLPEVPVDYVLAGQTLCQHNLAPEDRTEIADRLSRRPDLKLVYQYKAWKVLRVDRSRASVVLPP